MWYALTKHIPRYMTNKNKPEIKVGDTVLLRTQSGDVIEGKVMHLWEERSVLMVRVSHGDLVYNLPATFVRTRAGRKSK
jgi:hypothetical protein